MRKSLAIYLLGWVTLVPFCVWQLCTNATRDTLALWIMVPVGWVFMYFPVVVPLLMAWRIHQWRKLLDDPERLLAKLRGMQTGAGREHAIAFLARDSGMPKFAMRWLFDRFGGRFEAALRALQEAAPSAPSAPGAPSAPAVEPELANRR